MVKSEGESLSDLDMTDFSVQTSSGYFFKNHFEHSDYQQINLFFICIKLNNVIKTEKRHQVHLTGNKLSNLTASTLP